MEEITLPFVGDSIKTPSDKYQYPFGYIFATSSYTGGVATSQSFHGGSTSSTTSSTYYIPENLKTVTITGGNILYGAFDNCSNLTSIEIPDGMTSIGDYAFRGCSSLTSIEIPDGVASIGSYAFRDCSSLTSIEIPDSVTAIGNYAFYDCSSLTSIQIPDSVTAIGSSAFENCSSLTSIQIPDSVTSIGSYAFSNCSNLTTIAIPDGVTSIYASVFSDCSSLTSIEIPDSVTSIGSSAFYNCSNLTTIAIPDGVTSICASVFSGCSRLTSIEIPDSVTSIGNSAFYNCSSLTAIEIPDSVTSIASGTFSGCSSLQQMTLPFVGANRNTYSDDAYQYPLGYIFGTSSYTGGIATTQTYYSSFKYNTFDTDTTTYYIPESLKTLTITGGYILYGAFYNCNNLVTVEIFNNADSISDYAFYHCSSLVTIYIPDSVTSIGTYAFCGCSSLNSIVIPNKVTSIAFSAFSGCSSLQEITLPFVGSGVRTSSNTYQYPFGYIFGTSSYDGGVATSQTYYSAYSALEYDTFDTDTTTYYIPESLHGVVLTGGNILKGAFQNCSSLKYMVLQDHNPDFAVGAFSGCTGLEYVILPDTFARMDYYAFDECTALTDVFFIGNGDLSSVSSASYNRYFSKAYWHHVEQFGQLVTFQCNDVETANGTITYPGKFALKGETIPITVTPNTGYRFAGLTIDHGTPVDNYVTVAANGDFTAVTVSGSFEQITTEKELIASGTCGANVKWNLYDDGELYITGYEKMWDYTSSNIPWAKYQSLISKLTIDRGVTSIGNYAFYKFTALTDVSIAESVTKIGVSTFEGCTALTAIELPAELQRIEHRTFYGCTKLTGITLPKGLSCIAEATFYGCTSLEIAVLPENLLELHYYAFSKCSALKEIVLPDSLRIIYSDAFSDCTELASVKLPNSATYGSGIFRNCPKLVTLGPVGSGCTIEYPWTDHIPARVFDGCSSLKYATITADIKRVYPNAYNSTALEEVFYIGNPVEWLNIDIDSGNAPLTHKAKIRFVSSIDSIFNLTVVQPEHGSLRVDRHQGLAGDTVTVACDPKLGYRFSGIYVDEIMLKANTFNITSAHTVSASVFFYDEVIASGTCGASIKWCLYENGELYINGSGEMRSMIEYSQTNFGDSTLTAPWKNYVDSIKTVVMSPGITSVGEYAFYNCDALASVSLSSDLTTINLNAFESCDMLKSIVIPNSVKTIEGWAFYDCSALTSVTVGSSVKDIEHAAFSNCNKVNKVYYIGTKPGWDAITIEDYNSALTNAKRFYVNSMDNVYTITVGIVENGTVIVSQSACIRDMAVTVTATPAAGYQLASILVDGIPIKGNTFTVTGDHVVTAEFRQTNGIVVESAKLAIETYNWTVAQETAGTIDALKAWVEQQINNMALGGVSSLVEMQQIIPAQAGNSSDPNGSNGSFAFTVKLTSVSGDDAIQMEATIDCGIIAATQYTPVTYTVTYTGGDSATITSTSIPKGTKVLVTTYTQGKMTSVSIHIWPDDTSMQVPVSPAEDTRLFFLDGSWMPILQSGSVTH